MTTEDDRDLAEDPLDALVHAARPGAPPALAPSVMARVAARRSLRRAAIAGGALLAAAAIVLVWLNLPRGGRGDELASRPADHGPAVAPPRDAGPGPRTVVPADAAVPDWSDVPDLLDQLERAQRAAIARCVPAARVRELATFRTTPQRDGTSSTQLVIHHSLGYLGYSAEEQCLQKLVSGFALPPLPPGLESVAFTLVPDAAPGSGGAWLDPLRTARELFAPATSRITACAHAAADLHGAVAVFEPGGGPYRAVRRGARVRIELAAGAPASAQRCVAHVAAALAVPPLPERVDQLVLALPLAP